MSRTKFTTRPGSERRDRLDRSAGITKRSPFYRRQNKFILPKGTVIDYKDINLVQKFVSDRGKILPRRITGVSAKEQRRLAMAVKRARVLGLLSVGTRKR